MAVKKSQELIYGYKLIPVNQLQSTDEESKALETIVSL